jgi:hypothetical protein
VRVNYDGEININMKGLERVAYGSIWLVGKMTLLLALTSSSSGAQDQSIGIPANRPASCLAVDLCPEPEPDLELKCVDKLESYKDFISSQREIFDDSVVDDINKIIASEDKCADKVSQIDKVLSAYWATEPWCQRDRKLFLSLYKKVVEQIPTSSRETIGALLQQDLLSCSEALSAAVTIVRLSNPGFGFIRSNGYTRDPEDPSVVPGIGKEGDSGVASAMKREVASRAMVNSSKRQLKIANKRLRSCGAKVAKLRAKNKCR